MHTSIELMINIYVYLTNRNLILRKTKSALTVTIEVIEDAADSFVENHSNDKQLVDPFVRKGNQQDSSPNHTLF